MKTIGILGGLGPQATMDFEQRLHCEAQKLIPSHANEGYPKIVSYFFRQPPMAFNSSGEPLMPIKPNPELLKTAKTLGKISDFIAIPSNTPHFFIAQIQKASGRKVLSMLDVTIKAIKLSGAKLIGVMAVGVTLKNGLYQKKLEPLKIKNIELPEELSKVLDKSIFRYMEGKYSKADLAVAKQSLAYMRRQKADKIILGCTEIPLLLGKASKASDLINPAQLLAEAAIKYAII